jgi:hypothetical protein
MGSISIVQSREISLCQKPNFECVSVYKQDKDSPNSKAIAEKLEKAIKTANAYTKSRSYSEYCLAATLTGFVGIAAERNHLPESLKTVAFMAGLIGTAALSLYHHIYKSQDIQQVNQSVNECLKMLEKQKEQIPASNHLVT